jgi:hypothetical protein
MAEVKVETSAERPAGRAKPTGFSSLSPLQAGLLYGGSAATVSGPLGILVGLGAGILSKRLRDNFMDQEAADLQNLRSENKAFQNELTSELEIADPDEKRLLLHAQRLATDGWYRLEAGDQQGRAMIERANEIARSVMTADQQHRKQEQASQANFQRGLIGSAANSYRDQFQQNLSLAEDLDKQAIRVLDMVADPNFDPNKPFNKAILADLLQTGIGGMYRDAPDMLDAISQGAPGLGAIIGARAGPAGAAIGNSLGDIVQGITTGMKSKDFQVSREEYNRIALNMRKFTQQFASQRMERLGEQAQALNGFARSVGAIPEDYSLGDYVTGSVKELKFAPTPTLRNAAPTQRTQLKPLSLQNNPVSESLRNLEDFMNRRQRRPTN